MYNEFSDAQFYILELEKWTNENTLYIVNKWINI